MTPATPEHESPMTHSLSDQPIYVRVDEYQDVLDLLALIRERLGRAHQLLSSIAKVRQEEETELTQWSRSVGDLDRKVSEIDRLLFKPKY